MCNLYLVGGTLHPREAPIRGWRCGIRKDPLRFLWTFPRVHNPLHAGSASLSLISSSHTECLGPESSQDCNHDRVTHTHSGSSFILWCSPRAISSRHSLTRISHLGARGGAQLEYFYVVKRDLHIVSCWPHPRYGFSLPFPQLHLIQRQPGHVAGSVVTIHLETFIYLCVDLCTAHDIVTRVWPSL